MTMPDSPESASADTPADDVAPADINIMAQGDRRMLEALYLELRELAMEAGLEIKYQLSLTKPPDKTVL
jgi:hypothetical protein